MDRLPVSPGLRMAPERPEDCGPFSPRSETERLARELRMPLSRSSPYPAARLAPELPPLSGGDASRRDARLTPERGPLARSSASSAARGSGGRISPPLGGWRIEPELPPLDGWRIEPELSPVGGWRIEPELLAAPSVRRIAPELPLPCFPGGVLPPRCTGPRDLPEALRSPDHSSRRGPGRDEP